MTTHHDGLTLPLQFLKGVGPRRAADLEHAGLLTVEDLLYRFPIRYEDRSRLQPIASLKPGETASIAGRIVSCGLRSTRRPGSRFSRRDRRRQRIASRGLAEPAVPARRLRARPARRALWPLEMRGRTACSSPTRSTRSSDDERRGDEDDSHRTHRAGVREDRHVTPKMQRRLCTRRCSSCRRNCRTRSRKTFAAAASCRRATPR